MPKHKFTVRTCESLKNLKCRFADFSADGKTLITVHVHPARSDITIAFLDVASGKVGVKKKLRNPVGIGYGVDVGYSRAHGVLALGGHQQTILLSTNTLTEEHSLPYGISAIAWSAEGKLTAIADQHETIYFITAGKGKGISPFKMGKYEYAGQIGFIDGAPQLFQRSNEGIWIWNYKKRNRKKVARMPNLGRWAGARSADGKVAACVWETGEVMVSDTTTWKSRKFRMTGKFNHCSLSANGKLLVAARGSRIVIWDIDAGRSYLQWKRMGNHSVSHLSFSPDDKQLAFVMDDEVHILEGIL